MSVDEIVRNNGRNGVYRKLAESSGNVLGYEARGKLTEEVLGSILTDVEEAIDRFGKVNLLIYLPEIPRPDLGAVREDLEFARKHTKDIGRYAVVGGSALLDWVARLEGPLVNIEIKHFELDRLEEALAARAGGRLAVIRGVRCDGENTLFRGSTMGLQRWFYAGGRPNLIARLLDRGTASVSARGVGPEYLVALEVPGRRSGRIVSLPLVVATVGSERYLASMLGEEVNWVRNVSAAGGEVALRHGRREEVRLQGVVAPDLRAPVLKAYLKRATNASAHMPIDKDAPLAEFERLAPRFPVFRIVPRSTA